MAHVAKYKAAQVPAMVRHWERQNRNYSNENIDPERTALNYGWSPEGGALARMEELVSGLSRKPRKDAVVVADWVITAPRGLRSEDEGLFFATCYYWLCDRYGAGNVVTAQVHMDETTPHLHFAFMPITPDGRLCAKEVLSRNELKSFHIDLSKAVEKALGYSVELLLSDERAAEKALSGVPQEKLNAAKSAIEKETEIVRNELESIRQEVFDLEVERDCLKVDVEALQEEKSLLEKTVKALTSVVTGLLNKLGSVLPDPVLELARYWRDMDSFLIKKWHESIDESAQMLATKLPTRTEEEWDAMIADARERSSAHNRDNFVRRVFDRDLSL